MEKVFSSYFFNKITRPFRITRQLKIGKNRGFHQKSPTKRIILIINENMRKGLKRKTYQNLPSLICVEFLPISGIELTISRSKGLRLNDRDQLVA